MKFVLVYQNGPKFKGNVFLFCFLSAPVSKPTLSIWCEPEMTYCVLTCNGDTTDAELVTYRWTSGDITWSSTKEHNITKVNTG